LVSSIPRREREERREREREKKKGRRTHQELKQVIAVFVREDVIKERRETLVSRQTTKLSDDEIQRKKKIHSKKKKKKKVVSFPFHTKKNTKKWISIGDDDYSRDDNDERERR